MSVLMFTASHRCFVESRHRDGVQLGGITLDPLVVDQGILHMTSVNFNYWASQD